MTLHHDDHRHAQQLLQEGLSYAHDQHDTDGIVHCLAGMASVAVDQRQIERAAWHFGAVEAQLTGSGFDLSPVCRMECEHAVTSVRTQLGAAAFNAELLAGYALTIEQVFDCALEQTWRLLEIMCPMGLR